MLRFEQVSKVYSGGQQALRQVNFHLESGQMAFLTGHSGAGKSTLLKLISMIERPTGGKVWFDGQEVSRLPRKQVPKLRRQIGIIFQDGHLLMDRSVFANVALPLFIEGMSEDQAEKRVLSALDRVGLAGKEKYQPLMLSGGEQQRVGIARAIVKRPQLLLADEPTGNLDPKLSFEILRLFGALNDMGTTVLIATHDLALINEQRYRILTLNDGLMVDVRQHQETR